ncbi:MAG: class I lanthipeptide [Thermoanaerobaculia bacterium]
MKKTEIAKKLTLSKETLLHLSAPKLRRAVGQGWSDDSLCPTTTPSDCKRCQ